MSAADHVFDRYSTVTRPLLDRYVRYTAVRALGAAITPLCFYVLGAFLPSVPGRARDADHLIKTPPVDEESRGGKDRRVSEEVRHAGSGRKRVCG